MSSTYFERNNTKTNKPTTRTFHLHVGHKPRCKLLASVALVSMENFGNVEVVLLLPGGLRFATWKLQLTPTFLHAHSFSHYQYVKQRRIQVHIVSKFWKKILEVRNRNWYHVIIIINHIYIYYTHLYMLFHVFLYQGPPRRIAAVIQELEGSLRNGTHQILRSWSPRKKKVGKNMSGVNFGYGKNADFMIVFMIISCFWTRYVHIISNS